MNVLISQPREGQLICDDVVVIEGYAAANRLVDRVELSVDGGKTWIEAKLGECDAEMAWRFWEAHVRLRPGIHRIIARAAASHKNLWHRIKIKVEETD
jgi:hypothetical protein